MADYKIEHQAEEQLFFVALEDGQRAFLKYRHSGRETATAHVDFWSTFVPDSHRGKGLATQLVERGFEWAESQGLQIETSCWYAAKRIENRA